MERVFAAAAAGTPYDLVLMDMRMPVVGGIDATRAIREAGFDDAALPIVALTANAYADDIANCLVAGMQAHLAKPVGLAGLQTMIAQWCREDSPPLDAHRAVA